MARRPRATHLAMLVFLLAAAAPAATEAPALVLDGASAAVEPYTLEALGDEVTIDFTARARWPDAGGPAYDPVVLGVRTEPGAYRIRIARDRRSLVLDDGAAVHDVAFDFSDGAAHHVTLRTSGGKTHVAIDGNDQGELGATFPVGPETTLSVGSTVDGTDPFVGEIHSLRVWREALAPEPLARLASGEASAPVDPAPVAYLDFVDDRAVFAGTETQILEPESEPSGDLVTSRASSQRQSRIGSHRDQADSDGGGAEQPPQGGGAPPPNRPPPPVPGQGQLQADPPPLDPVPGGRPPPNRPPPPVPGQAQADPQPLAPPAAGRPPPNRPPPPVPGQQPVVQGGNPPRPPGLPPHLAQQAAAQPPGGPQAPAVGQPMGLPPGFPRPPQRARLRVEANSPRIYDGPVVPRFDTQRPGRQYPGRAVVGANGVARLESGHGPGQLGAFLGGGANSQVYRTANPNRVMKVVSLGEAGNTDRKARTIRDQMAGRAILADVLAANPRSPFRITQQDGPPELVEKTVNGRTYKFAVTTEENITSEVRDGRGRLLGNATNAADRARLKGGLSLAEELTISTVIRDLNRRGIVWTDHKLENLDVVPDPTSPTGHRVVFFDFDGFRPVNGGDGPARAQLAKNLQARFDSFSGWENLRQQLGGRRPNDFFDYTALGEPMSTLATPNANTRRQAYRDFSRLDDVQLQKAVETVAATPP